MAIKQLDLALSDLANSRHRTVAIGAGTSVTRDIKVSWVNTIITRDQLRDLLIFAEEVLEARLVAEGHAVQG